MKKNRNGLKIAAPAAKAATYRCDEVMVLYIVRAYDEHGRPCDEQILGAPSQGGVQPVKVFRGQTPDFWGAADAQTKKAMTPPAKK